MCPRPSPAHAREEPPTLHSEDVISSARWRDQIASGSTSSARATGSTGSRTKGDTTALERVPVQTMRGRIARAVRTPVVAGVAVFVVAVLVTIGITLVNSLGAQLPVGGSDAGAGAVFAGDAAGETEAAGGDSALASQGGAEAGSKADALGSNAAAGAAAKDVTGAPIFVHVVGAVEHAGVVELTIGDRVRDAIEAAGGASDEAVLAGVNLARLVVDGEQLLVPDEEALAAGGTHTAAEDGGAAPTPGVAGGADGGGSAAALVNLNTADSALLETLPRVGPALAGRIIDWREANGGYSSVDQLLEVSGIGAKTLEGFRDRVTV